MKFVFVSSTGDSIPIAMRVANEGHVVVVMIKDQMYRDAGVGEGLVTLGPAPSLDVILGENPDCVVFDMVGFGELAGALRAAKVPVFGGSLWADIMELRRGYATAVMAAVGIKTPTTKTFATAQKALEWVRSHPKRYVLKPSENRATAMTYVAKGPEDCIEVLERYAKDFVQEISVQEFVEGIEVSCEGWFNGKEFVKPFNITFEEKKFLEGNLGPNTGCMGNVVLTVPARARIVHEGIGRMEKVLRASDYRGPIDLNSIVTSDGLYGLEFTVRFGYDAVQALLEGLRGSLGVGGLLHGVATGTVSQMEVLHEYLIAVRLTVPPYPHLEKVSTWLSADVGRVGLVDVPVLGINDQNAKHLWPAGLKLKNGKFTGCSPDGNLLTATAWGSSLATARQRVYRTISNLTVADAQYRRDIGVRVQQDLARLQADGWLG